MSGETTVDKSKRGIVGLVLIFLIVIGDLIVGFADSPGKPSTFTRTLADTLYCAIASANCLNNYCNTQAVALAGSSDNCSGMYCGNLNAFNLGIPADQCSSNYNLGIHMLSDNSTKRTLSSSTFTTYTKALATNGIPAAVDSGTHQVSCLANAQIQSTNILAVVDFKIRETTFGRDGIVWRDNTLVANDNFTISYATYPTISGSTMFATSTSVFALQFSVTGTGAITVYHATIDCFIVDQLTGSVVS